MISKIKAYKQWLITKEYSSRSVNRYSDSAFNYSVWLQANRIRFKKAQYTNLMEYIGYLQSQEKTKIVINENLRGIRHYYTFLELPNIAYNIVLKGVKQYTTLFLNEEELQTIYDQYTGYVPNSYSTYSNKLVLGLYMYQALSVYDLLYVKVQDVNLEKGTLYVPAGLKKYNNRTVKLEAHQIIQIHRYITEHRQKARRDHKITDTDILIAPQGEKFSRIDEQSKRIHKDLKQLLEASVINYKSLQQLRQSRISHWIKQYGIRQAQYLSGRKKISSMERYKQMDLQDLSKQIELFHPMK